MHDSTSVTNALNSASDGSSSNLASRSVIQCMAFSEVYETQRHNWSISTVLLV